MFAGDLQASNYRVADVSIRIYPSPDRQVCVNLASRLVKLVHAALIFITLRNITMREEMSEKQKIFT